MINMCMPVFVCAFCSFWYKKAFALRPCLNSMKWQLSKAWPCRQVLLAPIWWSCLTSSAQPQHREAWEVSGSSSCFQLSTVVAPWHTHSWRSASVQTPPCFPKEWSENQKKSLCHLWSDGKKLKVVYMAMGQNERPQGPTDFSQFLVLTIQSHWGTQ